jgi:phage N-6-adenine-methyltransferase
MTNTETTPPAQEANLKDSEHIDIEIVVIPPTHRAIDFKKVDELAQSMARPGIGLMHAITVYWDGESTSSYEVVAGGHRLEAARSLGWEWIEAKVVHNRLDARLVTITENLHRNELSALERDEQIAEWIELTDRKGVSSQVETKPQGGRPEGGVRAAARELGIDKNDAHRAVKVAGLSPDAKEEARALDLDNNRSALLDAAKHTEPEEQVAALKHHRTQGTGNNEWFTPAGYIEAARDVLGEIDLDPATADEAQEYIRAGKYFTKETDGLTHEWHGRVWINPPYEQPHIANFVAKIVREVRAGRVSEAIMLTHSYTDTKWFHEAAEAASALCFTRGRIKFVAPDGRIAAPAQGQVFFYFGTQPEKFTETFQAFGFTR